MLQLVPQNHPLLIQPTPNFDFNNPPTDPIQLAKDMAACMKEYGGLGLAAPQVGLPYRCFVFGNDKIHTVFNPRIVDATSEEIYLVEGCLTFPFLLIKIKRPRSVRVRYTHANGETVTNIFDGMTARIFLHELDHLDGILFMSRANKIHLEQAKNKMRRLRKKQGVD